MIAKPLPSLLTIIRLITLFGIINGLIFYPFLASHEWQVGIGMMILLGIPHGATDHLIFVRLSRPFLGAKGLEQFYYFYLLLIVCYAVVWWLSPILAFGIFLTISVYHFGQSNWVAAIFPTKMDAALTYLCWGAFVLFIPIIWHFDTASEIIAVIAKQPVSVISESWQIGICLTLLVLNCGVALYWWMKGTLDFRALRNELLNLGLLTVLFFSTPLLLGFTIYFVFWHSLGSVIDQISFFRRHFQWYNWRRYAWQTLPFSFAAVGGLGLLFWLKTLLGLQPDISMLFIFISVVTLPHMLLMDQLYEECKQSGDTLAEKSNLKWKFGEEPSNFKKISSKDSIISEISEPNP